MDTVVSKLSYCDIASAGFNCHTKWEIELAVTCTRSRAKGLEVVAKRVKDLDAVVVTVSYYDIVSSRIKCNTKWIIKLAIKHSKETKR